MIQVGLTGGIGSGKSTVAKIFERFGVPVYYADQRSKMILDSDVGLKNSIADTFSIPLSDNGNIDKKQLAAIVFSDKLLLEKLNKLVHPKVAEDYQDWVGNQLSPYVLKEAAILFESGSYKGLGKIIVVDAPEEIRVERVMLRDKVDRQSVLKRIKNQWPDQKKRALADYIISNDNSKSILVQSAIIHQQILASS